MKSTKSTTPTSSKEKEEKKYSRVSKECQVIEKMMSTENMKMTKKDLKKTSSMMAIIITIIIIFIRMVGEEILTLSTLPNTLMRLETRSNGLY